MSGGFIELRDSSIDFRDYLDGVPIHNGEQLQLFVDGEWKYTRYELADFRKREVVLISSDRVRRLDRGSMLCRWPPKE